MRIDQDVFSELLNLLPIIQETSLECLRKELDSFKHDRTRMSMEREGFLRFFRFLQRKWAIDIIYVLLIQEELHFNEIRRLLEGVSSRTLTDRLVELEERGVINRKVQQTRPVKVMYSLTNFGKGLVALLVPVFLYASSDRSIGYQRVTPLGHASPPYRVDGLQNHARAYSIRHDFTKQ